MYAGVSTFLQFLKELLYAELKRRVEDRKDWRTRSPRTCL